MRKGSYVFAARVQSICAEGQRVDLAVGVVIGGAFGKIVTALVNDLIMPFVAAVLPGQEWRELDADAAQVQGRRLDRFGDRLRDHRGRAVSDREEVDGLLQPAKQRRHRNTRLPRVPRKRADRGQALPRLHHAVAGGLGGSAGRLRADRCRSCACGAGRGIRLAHARALPSQRGACVDASRRRRGRARCVWRSPTRVAIDATLRLVVRRAAAPRACAPGRATPAERGRMRA